MYEVGTLVVYGGSGVCRVDAVGASALSGGAPARSYYTLAPLYGTETIYAPVDTKVAMRSILTRDEALDLIREMPAIEPAPLDIRNPQALSRYYQDTFQAHDCRSLVRLLKTIHAKNAALRKAGKKPGKIEERYQKRAEELLYGELALVLGIPVEQVPPLIKHTLRTQDAKLA